MFPIDLYPTTYAEWPEWAAQPLAGLGPVYQVAGALGIPIYRANMAFEAGSQRANQARTFWASLEPGESFDFYSCDPEALYEALSVGTGDGTTHSWVIPFTYPLATSVLTPVAYVAGVAVSAAFGVENRCVESEDLSKTAVWLAYLGATVTRTSGQTDPEGGSTAWRIQTSGGTNVMKLHNNWGSPAPALGRKVYHSVWVKNVGAVSLVVVQKPVYNSTTIAADSTWHELAVSDTADGIQGGNLSFRTTAVGDSLDFHVWHPWSALEDSPTFSGGDPGFGEPVAGWGYIPTRAAALTADSRRRMRVALYAVPTTGQAVSIDAAGRYLRKMIFEPEPLSMRSGSPRRYEFALKLVEVA